MDEEPAPDVEEIPAEAAPPGPIEGGEGRIPQDEVHLPNGVIAALSETIGGLRDELRLVRGEIGKRRAEGGLVCNTRYSGV